MGSVSSDQTQLVCAQCTSVDLLRSSGGYLVVGLGSDEEVALVYHHKPQIPSFDDHGFPDLPSPGYLSFEHLVCVECGWVLKHVPQTQLGLLAELQEFVQKVNEIELKRYGSRSKKDIEDVQSERRPESSD